MSELVVDLSPYLDLRCCAQVGHALRAARKRASLTQTQAAERVGVSRKWISDAENGKQGVQLGLLLALVTTLGYRVDLVPCGESSSGLETNSQNLDRSEP